MKRNVIIKTSKLFTHAFLASSIAISNTPISIIYADELPKIEIVSEKNENSEGSEDSTTEETGSNSIDEIDEIDETKNDLVEETDEITDENQIDNTEIENIETTLDTDATALIEKNKDLSRSAAVYSSATFLAAMENDESGDGNQYILHLSVEDIAVDKDTQKFTVTLPSFVKFVDLNPDPSVTIVSNPDGQDVATFNVESFATSFEKTFYVTTTVTDNVYLELSSVGVTDNIICLNKKKLLVDFVEPANFDRTKMEALWNNKTDDQMQEALITESHALKIRLLNLPERSSEFEKRVVKITLPEEMHFNKDIMNTIGYRNLVGIPFKFSTTEESIEFDISNIVNYKEFLLDLKIDGDKIYSGMDLSFSVDLLVSDSSIAQVPTVTKNLKIKDYKAEMESLTENDSLRSKIEFYTPSDLYEGSTSYMRVFNRTPLLYNTTLAETGYKLTNVTTKFKFKDTILVNGSSSGVDYSKISIPEKKGIDYTKDTDYSYDSGTDEVVLYSKEATKKGFVPFPITVKYPAGTKIGFNYNKITCTANENNTGNIVNFRVEEGPQFDVQPALESASVDARLIANNIGDPWSWPVLPAVNDYITFDGKDQFLFALDVYNKSVELEDLKIKINVPNDVNVTGVFMGGLTPYDFITEKYPLIFLDGDGNEVGRITGKPQSDKYMFDTPVKGSFYVQFSKFNEVSSTCFENIYQDGHWYDYGMRFYGNTLTAGNKTFSVDTTSMTANYTWDGIEHTDAKVNYKEGTYSDYPGRQSITVGTNTRKKYMDVESYGGIELLNGSGTDYINTITEGGSFIVKKSFSVGAQPLMDNRIFYKDPVLYVSVPPNIVPNTGDVYKDIILKNSSGKPYDPKDATIEKMGDATGYNATSDGGSVYRISLKGLELNEENRNVTFSIRFKVSGAVATTSEISFCDETILLGTSNQDSLGVYAGNYSGALIPYNKSILGDNGSTDDIGTNLVTAAYGSGKQTITYSTEEKIAVAVGMLEGNGNIVSFDPTQNQISFPMEKPASEQYADISIKNTRRGTTSNPTNNHEVTSYFVMPSYNDVYASPFGSIQKSGQKIDGTYQIYYTKDAIPKNAISNDVADALLEDDTSVTWTLYEDDYYDDDSSDSFDLEGVTAFKIYIKNFKFGEYINLGFNFKMPVITESTQFAFNSNAIFEGRLFSKYTDLGGDEEERRLRGDKTIMYQLEKSNPPTITPKITDEITTIDYWTGDTTSLNNNLIPDINDDMEETYPVNLDYEKSTIKVDSSINGEVESNTYTFRQWVDDGLSIKNNALKSSKSGTTPNIVYTINYVTARDDSYQSSTDRRIINVVDTKNIIPHNISINSDVESAEQTNKENITFETKFKVPDITNDIYAYSANIILPPEVDYKNTQVLVDGAVADSKFYTFEFDGSTNTLTVKLNFSETDKDQMDYMEAFIGKDVVIKTNTSIKSGQPLNKINTTINAISQSIVNNIPTTMATSNDVTIKSLSEIEVNYYDQDNKLIDREYINDYYIGETATIYPKTIDMYYNTTDRNETIQVTDFNHTVNFYLQKNEKNWQNVTVNVIDKETGEPIELDGYPKTTSEKKFIKLEVEAPEIDGYNLISNKTAIVTPKESEVIIDFEYEEIDTSKIANDIRITSDKVSAEQSQNEEIDFITNFTISQDIRATKETIQIKLPNEVNHLESTIYLDGVEATSALYTSSFDASTNTLNVTINYDDVDYINSIKGKEVSIITKTSLKNQPIEKIGTTINAEVISTIGNSVNGDEETKVTSNDITIKSLAEIIVNSYDEYGVLYNTHYVRDVYVGDSESVIPNDFSIYYKATVDSQNVIIDEFTEEIRFDYVKNLDNWQNVTVSLVDTDGNQIEFFGYPITTLEKKYIEATYDAPELAGYELVSDSKVNVTPNDEACTVVFEYKEIDTSKIENNISITSNKESVEQSQNEELDFITKFNISEDIRATKETIQIKFPAEVNYLESSFYLDDIEATSELYTSTFDASTNTLNVTINYDNVDYINSVKGKEVSIITKTSLKNQPIEKVGTTINAEVISIIGNSINGDEETKVFSNDITIKSLAEIIVTSYDEDGQLYSTHYLRDVYVGDNVTVIPEEFDIYYKASVDSQNVTIDEFTEEVRFDYVKNLENWQNVTVSLVDTDGNQLEFFDYPITTLEKKNIEKTYDAPELAGYDLVSNSKVSVTPNDEACSVVFEYKEIDTSAITNNINIMADRDSAEQSRNEDINFTTMLKVSEDTRTMAETVQIKFPEEVNHLGTKITLNGDDATSELYTSTFDNATNTLTITINYDNVDYIDKVRGQDIFIMSSTTLKNQPIEKVGTTIKADVKSTIINKVTGEEVTEKSSNEISIKSYAEVTISSYDENGELIDTTLNKDFLLGTTQTLIPQEFDIYYKASVDSQSITIDEYTEEVRFDYVKNLENWQNVKVSLVDADTGNEIEFFDYPITTLEKKYLDITYDAPELAGYELISDNKVTVTPNDEMVLVVFEYKAVDTSQIKNEISIKADRDSAEQSRNEVINFSTMLKVSEDIRTMAETVEIKFPEEVNYLGSKITLNGINATSELYTSTFDVTTNTLTITINYDNVDYIDKIRGQEIFIISGTTLKNQPIEKVGTTIKADVKSTITNKINGEEVTEKSSNEVTIKSYAKIIINSYDENGELIDTTYNKDLLIGTTQTFIPKEFDIYYKASVDSQNVTIDEYTQEVRFDYVKNLDNWQNVKVYLVDSDGLSLINYLDYPRESLEKKNIELTYTAPNIDGYNLISSSSQTIVPTDENNEVIFFYKAIDVNKIKNDITITSDKESAEQSQNEIINFTTKFEISTDERATNETIKIKLPNEVTYLDSNVYLDGVIASSELYTSTFDSTTNTLNVDINYDNLDYINSVKGKEVSIVTSTSLNNQPIEKIGMTINAEVISTINSSVNGDEETKVFSNYVKIKSLAEIVVNSYNEKDELFNTYYIKDVYVGDTKTVKPKAFNNYKPTVSEEIVNVDSFTKEVNFYYSKQNNNGGGDGDNGGHEIVKEPIDPEPTDTVTDDVVSKVYEPYIVGYKDGTVRADNIITRAEFATIAYRVKYDGNTTDNEYYKDVSGNSWYSEQVNYLTSIGILNGYDDKTFRANEPIKRAELATMLSKINGVNNYTKNDNIKVKDYWATKYIYDVVNNGIMIGYPNGEFLEDEYVTRGETVMAVNKLLGREVSKDVSIYGDAKLPTDIDASHKAYYDMLDATIKH